MKNFINTNKKYFTKDPRTRRREKLDIVNDQIVVDNFPLSYSVCFDSVCYN